VTLSKAPKQRKDELLETKTSSCLLLASLLGSYVVVSNIREEAMMVFIAYPW